MIAHRDQIVCMLAVDGRREAQLAALGDAISRMVLAPAEYTAIVGSGLDVFQTRWPRWMQRRLSLSLPLPAAAATRSRWSNILQAPEESARAPVQPRTAAQVLYGRPQPSVNPT
jgi:hypothetical protein